MGGFWLFRWGRRNDRRAELSEAATEAAFAKLRKRPGAPGQTTAQAPAKRDETVARFRNSMAQFLGIVGLLMILGGIVAMVFGIFYVSD